jgi:hypothetical protein
MRDSRSDAARSRSARGGQQAELDERAAPIGRGSRRPIEHAPLRANTLLRTNTRSAASGSETSRLLPPPRRPTTTSRTAGLSVHATAELLPRGSRCARRHGQPAESRAAMLLLDTSTRAAGVTSRKPRCTDHQDGQQASPGQARCSRSQPGAGAAGGACGAEHGCAPSRRRACGSCRACCSHAVRPPSRQRRWHRSRAVGLRRPTAPHSRRREPRTPGASRRSVPPETPRASMCGARALFAPLSLATQGAASMRHSTGAGGVHRSTTPAAPDRGTAPARAARAIQTTAGAIPGRWHRADPRILDPRDPWCRRRRSRTRLRRRSQATSAWVTSVRCVGCVRWAACRRTRHAGSRSRPATGRGDRAWGARRGW